MSACDHRHRLWWALPLILSKYSPGLSAPHFSNSQQSIQERILICEPHNPIPGDLECVTLSSWKPAWKLTLAREVKQPVKRLVGSFWPSMGNSSLMGIQCFHVSLIHREYRLPVGCYYTHLSHSLNCGDCTWGACVCFGQAKVSMGVYLTGDIIMGLSWDMAVKKSKRSRTKLCKKSTLLDLKHLSRIPEPWEWDWITVG